TAARSPALAAVTSGTLLWLTLSAASAAPARIEELSRPASTMVHLFIGVLPHMSLVARSDKVLRLSVRLTNCPSDCSYIAALVQLQRTIAALMVHLQPSKSPAITGSSPAEIPE